MRTVRAARTIAVAGGVLVAALVAWRMWGSTRVPVDAQPEIARFLEAIDRGDAGGAWGAAPVVASMRSVLGPREETGEATVASAADARLDVEVPVRCANGRAVMALRLTRGTGGTWSVSDCAARSDAFEWRFR